MTDLTKIEKPFGLLDEETQAALKAHGGPYEYVSNDGWTEIAEPFWAFGTTYRVKPKPREFWVVQALGPNPSPHAIGAWGDKETAERVASMAKAPHEIIHVREVLK